MTPAALPESADDRYLVWLASYPKSGNTWIRAILSALERGSGLFTLAVLGSGGQPYSLGGALGAFGLDARWLSRTEAERLRLALTLSHPTTDIAVHKTHERYRTMPVGWPESERAPEPFPVARSRAAIHLVRDPRDVAPSLAHHFSLSHDEAVDSMGRTRDQPGDPARLMGEQPWGSWSMHTRSWMRDDIPFPVHRVRFEDLRREPVETLLPVLRAIGINVDGDRLAEAVDRVRLDRLREDEDRIGFAERRSAAGRFFRRGEVGGWRSELDAALVRAIEADHAATMRLVGYEPDHDDLSLAPTVEARSARRRHATHRWDRLPAHLGIDVSQVPVPESLPGAVDVGGFADVLPESALVRLTGGNRIHVSKGRRAGVHVPEEQRGSGDAGWLVQGWAVAVAMNQRGLLTIHGSAVEINGRGICIAGASGAGKSTTALGLRRRGHRLLVDDVSIVSSMPAGPLAVVPYLRGVHLTPRAAQQLQIDYENLPHLSSGRGKATYFAEDPGSDPAPLARIVILTRDPSATVPSCHDVTGADRLGVLREVTSRDGVTPAILGPARYFGLLAELADSVPVTRLRRPARGWSLEDVLDSIEALSCGQPIGGPDAP